MVVMVPTAAEFAKRSKTAPRSAETTAFRQQ
jgi:hypothetical protein